MYEEDYRPRSPSGPGWLGVVLVSIITSCGVLLAFLLAVQKGLLTVHNIAEATSPSAAHVSPEKPGATHVKVPALVGLPVASATELLAARGLHVVLRTKRANPAAADTVIAQDPLADSMLPRDAQVVVELSSGPPGNVPVPAVLGLPLDDALAALASAGLKPGKLLGPDGGERVVSGSEPAPGTPAEKGSSVRLTVELAGSEVPKLVGINLTKAKKLITDAGFTVGKIKARYDEHIPAYLILTQRPEAGSKAQKGSAIELVYSEE